jgi:hypothetical protein
LGKSRGGSIFVHIEDRADDAPANFDRIGTLNSVWCRHDHHSRRSAVLGWVPVIFIFKIHVHGRRKDGQFFAAKRSEIPSSGWYAAPVGWA